MSIVFQGVPGPAYSFLMFSYVFFSVAIWVTDLLAGQDADSSFAWKHSHRILESGNIFACLCLVVLLPFLTSFWFSILYVRLFSNLHSLS